LAENHADNRGDASGRFTLLRLALRVTGLAETIDACLLRLLDQRIRSAMASHHCDTLGPINASIAGAIGPTWTGWHASLTADKALLDAFLRWLANVEQHEHSPWNDDHARIPHLATALVMMLATHHGEPLEPALVDRGNLKFSHNAVALGSGCDTVGHQPIAIWDQPDQWGVDALILSGSAEVEVMDPPGRVLDGGRPAMGMAAARRVRPVDRQAERGKSCLRARHRFVPRNRQTPKPSGKSKRSQDLRAPISALNWKTSIRNTSNPSGS
jgi:hypothetical protein